MPASDSHSAASTLEGLYDQGRSGVVITGGIWVSRSFSSRFASVIGWLRKPLRAEGPALNIG